MSSFNESSGNQGDRVVTVFAIFAIILAVAISVVTMGSHEIIQLPVDDPMSRADEAASAGISAAKGHIECHGLKQRGALPRQFFANGGRFEVAWGDLNPADSTVRVVSTGFYEIPGIPDEFGAKSYCSRLESTLKVNLIATHNQSPILARYYQRYLSLDETKATASR